MPPDALAIARDLLRCPSVTPADAGALGVLENLLAGADFQVHRVSFSEPGAADVENVYARIGSGSPSRRGTRAHGAMARSRAR
jgi:succinyl-diaminopimelate desuccinylase